MGERIPLTREDCAILALERGPVAGHTCKVVVVGPGGLDLTALRAAVARRVGAVPALTRRLGGPAEAPEWVSDPEFDVEAHVARAPLDGPLDAAGLRTEVARLFAERLDRSRPLWRMEVLALAGGGDAVVWRLHHALADGTAAMRYSAALLWDAEPEPRAAAPARRAAERADDARRRAHLVRFIERELGVARERSPFDGHIGRERRVAFAEVPLGALHDAARRLGGATLNDGVLCLAAGAVGRWVRHGGGHLATARVRVPVSLHHEGDDASNRDSFFSVGVPLDEPDPVARLAAVRAATAVRKAERDAERLEEVSRALDERAPAIEHLWSRLEDSPRSFAVCVSNVVGPRAPVSVLGVPVRRLHTLAEIGERHALRIAVVSFAGTLAFGFCADAALVPDPGLMAEAVEAEAEALIAAG